MGVGARHRGPRLRPRAHLGHGPHHRRRSRADLARRRRRAAGADPAPGRRQLLADGRHRPVRPVLRDHLRPRARVRPGGGPAEAEDRYVEIWNLVFMQFDARPDGELVAAAPTPTIDTGAGLERNLTVLQGVDSVWDTDVLRPLIEAAPRSPASPTAVDERTTSSLRILAEHGRTMTFLVADGVVPSNEDRGYVLRRIIRRAVRHAFLLGAEKLVTPALVDATVDVMGEAYPEIVKQHELVARRGEPRGGALPPDAARPASTSSTASCRPGRRHRRRRVLPARHPRFPDRPHARDRGRARARASTSTASRAMNEQRTRAKEAHKAGRQGDGAPRRALPRAGRRARPHRLHRAPGVRDRRQGALAVVPVARLRRRRRGHGRASSLDRTPFYAESGGQVGDTGVIETVDRRASEVDDTQYGLPGLVAAPRRGRGGRDRRRRRGRRAASTATGATRSAATTPPPTSCTGRCARCSART